MNADLIKELEDRGIKPTANRILVLKAMSGCGGAYSLKDIEDNLDTVDKSSVFRTLRVFKEYHLIHEVYDGTGAVKYELCRCKRNERHDDQHVHFYCTSCHRTICMGNIPVPAVELPAGFEAESINYVISGVCDVCSAKK